jgi:hypothetical protein
MNKIIFITPIMKISSVEERFSKKTEKPYIVVKASQYSEKRPMDFMKKKYLYRAITFLCFKETLIGLFEEDNIHIFHGEIEPTWGSTFLHITSLFDDEGKRLLRPLEKKDGSYPERVMGRVSQILEEEENLRKQKRKQRMEQGRPCIQECDECEDMDCFVNLPY